MKGAGLRIEDARSGRRRPAKKEIALLALNTLTVLNTLT